MKKTKIIGTIGPASDSKDIFAKLVKKGLNVARLNFSHGGGEEQLLRMNMIKEVRKELNIPVAILLDTKGPEIRTRSFKDGKVELKEGQFFTLTTEEILGNETICSLTYKELYKDVKKGNIILIDDGIVELVVEELVGKDIKCIVKSGGIVKDKRGVNVPGVKTNLPGITKKDKEDIEFGIEQGIDFIAASFVRNAEAVRDIKKILKDKNGEYIQIISKIENQEGIENLDEIIEESDAIMIARGDLGVEIPTESMPSTQKRIIKKCNRVGKPVITATHMLDSMIRNHIPTRAEVTDVANAIYDGTDAIMLSGETAIGKFPVETVRLMSNIAIETEKYLDYESLLKSKRGLKHKSISNAVAFSTCRAAEDIGVKAIITATLSGFTARIVSKFRPQFPIIAVTTSEKSQRRMLLNWGVIPLFSDNYVNTTDGLIESVIEESKNKGYLKKGDITVITAGIPVGEAVKTNFMKIHEVK